MTMKMRYVASLFFKSVHTKPDEEKSYGGVWEEVFILILAGSEAEAWLRAESIGKERSGFSYATDDSVVLWTYVKTERIHLIEEGGLEDGQEIFCRFLKAAEAESILQTFD